ncbi:polysaccharide deacetylase family protein [Solibacillus sp. CAU 1738]|uniref:polysaccharide deacetylase family protein n=1 Tax=Solibacillus sp. CAU 1738 TaxID=3140363 RepID=UPI0032607419
MKRILLTALCAFSFFLFVGKTAEAKQTTIEISQDTVARLHLQHEPIKYITLYKGQHFVATKGEDIWEIQIGNGMVSIASHFAVASNAAISNARILNKVEINTVNFANVYPKHEKKGKPIATIAKDMRISSNGRKGDFYEVIIGGRKGYIHFKDVELDKGVPVLIYHHFVKDQKKTAFHNNLSVYDIDLFEQQMQYLKQNGFTTITLQDFDLWTQRKQNLPAKAVVLTFDDGNLSIPHLVYPILKQYNMRGASFIIGDRVKEDAPEFEMLKVQFAGLKELAMISDIIDLEHHTYALHRFNYDTGRGYLQDTKLNDLRRDFQHTTEIIQRANPAANPKYLAYPYGKYSKNQEIAIIDSGVSLAFLNKGGKAKINSPRLYVPRVPIQATTTLAQFKQLVNN